jgi:hypothetical protein
LNYRIPFLIKSNFYFWTFPLDPKLQLGIELQEKIRRRKTVGENQKERIGRRESEGRGAAGAADRKRDPAARAISGRHF